MSDQLTWEGLLPNKPETKKSAKKTKTAESKKIDPDIEARINRLIEAKNKVEKELITKSEVVEVKETIIFQKTEIEIEIQPEPEKAAPEIITVSTLNNQIKNLLEKNFPFLWVKGEISNLKIPTSGHLYFTLKDSNAQIRAVMFRGFAQGLKFKPEDGMEVLVRCKVTAYEPRGDYQLFCEVMEPVGFGALQIAFEQLKEKLKKEGLFEETRKRPIPQFPTRIGIITSPTGAAIRDMLNILSRRSGGGVEITILPPAFKGTKLLAK